MTNSQPPQKNDLFYVLGIETSCDETAAAVVSSDLRVCSNVVSTQIAIHQKYGGVVPELASRAHLEGVLPIIDLALQRAQRSFDDINAIAVTQGPGLIGALMVGVQTAKALAWSHNLPLVGVNHLQAHIAAVHLHDDRREPLGLKPPYVALAVSGGHTALYRVDDPQRLTLLGQTLDDAAGEAFDKVAKMLGLGYPGGKAIDDLAKTGDANAIDFPRAWLPGRRNHFSFSGLKTSVRAHIKKNGVPSGHELSNVAASFQEAVVHVLVKKTIRAAREAGVKAVVLGGGVAANSRLREAMKEAGRRHRIRVYPVPLRYCSDNAAMIAGLGAIQLERGCSSTPLDFDADLAIKMGI